MNRQLAMASLDPNAAIAAAARASQPGPRVVEPRSAELVIADRAAEPFVLAVEVQRPKPLGRWRFFVFWLLIRLAAKVYPFKLEIYRADGGDR